jgi:nitrogen fixation protein NifX
MKIAFTSTTGEVVDQHFGRAAHFYVWQIGPDEARFVERVAAPDVVADEEDRTTARAEALTGCAVVYTVQIGGPAAAKLVARRIHPMKTQREVPVAHLVARLQTVLKDRPPPWLKKAMNGGA